MTKARTEIMHRIATVILVALGIVLTGFTETVENVRGSQRPNSNLVDIYYDLNAADGGTYTVEVAIEGCTNEVTATTFRGDVGKGIAPGKNHSIVWEAGADWRGKKGDVKAVVTATIEDKHNRVQLWEGGPYWADRNIGANSPWKPGLYFWWGDTTGHRPSGGKIGFSFEESNCPTSNKSIAELQSAGWIVSKDGTYVLAPAHDAAHVKWGGGWRMPTYQELSDLKNNCDWTWTTQNGVNGCVVRGRGGYASNSIFLPCGGLGGRFGYISVNDLVGYYWSSVPFSNDDNSRFLRVDSDGLSMRSYYRYLGFFVRPVQGFTK